MKWKQFTEDWSIINLMLFHFYAWNQTKEIFLVISNFHQDKVSFEQRLVSKKIYDVRWENTQGAERGVQNGDVALFFLWRNLLSDNITTFNTMFFQSHAMYFLEYLALS